MSEDERIVFALKQNVRLASDALNVALGEVEAAKRMLKEQSDALRDYLLREEGAA